MGKNKIQLLFVPEDGGPVRSIRVSARWLPAALVSVTLALVFATVSIILYLDVLQSRHETERVRAENIGLRDDLQSISSRIDEALASVRRNEALEREARLLAGLDPVETQDPKPGMGGPLTPVPTFTEDPGIRAELIDQFQQLDELEHRIALQARSYQEALGALETNREHLERMPTVEPIEGPYAISSSYGWREDPFTGEDNYHYGIDFRAPLGTPVRATAAGEVSSVGQHADYGLMVTIDHGDGVETRFAHLESTQCREGTRVQRGDIIGTLGSSGRSTGPHVHYEVRVNGIAQNPERYIVSRDFAGR
jgi:murein DD-endopeptidase MepM/ murein hydrolase activator NlpD